MIPPLSTGTPEGQTINKGLRYDSFHQSIRTEERYLRYTRFENARIIGARALQISLNAPILLDIPDDLLDPLAIARMEFEAGLIPISTKKRSPKEA